MKYCSVEQGHVWLPRIHPEGELLEKASNPFTILAIHLSQKVYSENLEQRLPRYQCRQEGEDTNEFALIYTINLTPVRTVE